MTPHAPLDVRSLPVSQLRPFVLVLALLLTIPTHAQTPQQRYVYASTPVTTITSQVSSFSTDPATGNLVATPTPVAPDRFEGGLLTVDAKGRFVFVLNPSTSKISMFAIDSNTGNLNEVQGSPFAAGISFNYLQAPASPACLAVESSGQFLYVGYNHGNIPGMGAINTFTIDSAHSQLVPLLIQPTTDISSSPIGLLSIALSPSLSFLYVGLGNPGETLVYQIDPLSGQLESNGFAGSALGLVRSIALDSQGRFFFEGWGLTAGHIDSAPISPVDGTATIGVARLNLNSGELPQALLAESSGKFLYVQQTTGVAAYAIDQNTGALTQAQAPAQIFSFHTGQAAADPLGPYLYVLQNDGVHAFQVDPQAGALGELSESPFSTGSIGIGGIAISGSAAPVQAVSGPAASLYPPSPTFSSTIVGQSSSAQMIYLTNTGDQLLLIRKISVGGINASDFTAAPTCTVSLQSGQTCTISVTFTPTGAGARQANLSVTDNTSAGSQSIALTGVGVPQQPDVTLNPPSFTFATPVNQGSTSQPQSVSITNDGTATLHITSIAIDSTSANASDFSLTSNNCGAALAVRSTCVLTATFSPLGNGQRTANVLVVDDAPGSPQQIPLTGTGAGAPVTHPGISFNPTSMTFPVTPQGSSSPAQSLTITSSGTGTLHIVSITVVGANPGDFALTNNCASPAYVPQTICTVSLVFTPSTVAATLGPRSATMVVADDAPNSPQSITISGTSTDATQPISAAPSVTVNSGNSAQTVKAGATATWNLNLTPNFTGNLTFTCAGGPTASSCSAPSTVKVSAGTSLPAPIAVTTTGSSATASTNFPELPHNTIPPFFAQSLLLFFAALARSHLGRAFSRRGSYSRPIALTPIAVVLIAIATVSISGCGGGSVTPQGVPVSQPTPNPATPQGTYTITVALTAAPSDGKSTAPISPILLTLTVQ